MKERYLDIMSRVVNVYTPDRFDALIETTRTEGIKEHGFPRLCANIGILMAHGKCLDLKHRFDEMMEICCRDLPVVPQKGKRGNDFSIREIVSCILELEKTDLYPQETICAWKKALSAIQPKTHYRMVAPEPPVAVNNWAAFNAASEQIRCYAGLADTHSYIDNQIASQLFSFDENGMYRDPNDPMVYDVVTRDMLAACLLYGYKGKHKEAVENVLEKAGPLTLLMQSVTGELAYGGRSNQFLHNEAHLAVSFEAQAKHHWERGNREIAYQNKAAAKLALDCIEHWLDNAPGQHIKNYFPIESQFGCEDYAYYDKYMVTAASFLYLAYCFCDDTIPATTCPATEDGSYAWATSKAFRKVFCKSGPYFVEAELISDPHYDACGIGRIHRRGAPSPICLSVPAPISPNYEIGRTNPMGLSICAGAFYDKNWLFASDEGGYYILKNFQSSENLSSADFEVILPIGESMVQSLTVSPEGVSIRVKGNGRVGLILPAFLTDGALNTEIQFKNNQLNIHYKGWICSYKVSGDIIDTTYLCSNRNGEYRLYRAEDEQSLTVHISIIQE